MTDEFDYTTDDASGRRQPRPPRYEPLPDPVVQHPPGLAAREPVVTVASITATVAAVIALLVAFGFDLSAEQQTAIVGVVAVVAPLVAAAFQRPRVTPVE